MAFLGTQLDFRHFNLNAFLGTGLDKDEDSLWTEDNILLLMEEMLVVKERRDKHLLKNRVVFREIADTLNAEGVQVDWKQVMYTQYFSLIYLSIYLL